MGLLGLAVGGHGDGGFGRPVGGGHIGKGGGGNAERAHQHQGCQQAEDTVFCHKKFLQRGNIGDMIPQFPLEVKFMQGKEKRAPQGALFLD